jgi:hypothetical protein
MRSSPFVALVVACAASLLAAPAATAQKSKPAKEAKAENGNDLPHDTAAPANAEAGVPEDLLEDEHLREEFGVNTFTAPSIKKLFADLATLGALPYEKLRRDLPKDAPRDRSQVALSLGMLIADGFLMVTTEKISEFEQVGRGVLKHAKALGAGDRISRHTKTIIENSAGGDWDVLKDELAKTQSDVEAELVLLRDHEIAQLISLGGWIRGLEISAAAASEPFSPKKAAVLARADLIEFFQYSLLDLPEKVRARDPLKSVMSALDEIHALLNKPEPGGLTAEDVEFLRAKAHALGKLIGAGTAKK